MKTNNLRAGGAQRPGAARILLWYGTPAVAIYFFYMLVLQRPIEANGFLALNLAVSVALAFLVGLAINRWARGAGPRPARAAKIALAAVAIIAADLVLSAVISGNLGFWARLAGDWLAVDFAAIPRIIENPIVLHRAVAIPLHLLTLTFGLLAYRSFCFGGRGNYRLFALFAALYFGCISSVIIHTLVYGGGFNFIAVGGFGSLALSDLLLCVFVGLSMQVIFFELRGEGKSLREYFASEAAKLRAFFGRKSRQEAGAE
ncbi:MAG: hypothetical protein FWE09_07435 [Treponema sp.]|nr:hypothetical protein [Treponema sp.]